MQLSDIIPEYLLKDQSLLAVYCYLLCRVRPKPSKFIANSKVIAVAANETCEGIVEISHRVGVNAETVEVAIHKLEELDLLQVTQEGDFYRIRFVYLALPNQEVAHNRPEARHYNDCLFSEFEQAYLEYVETNLSPKTRQNAGRVMKLFSAFLGPKKLDELTAEDLEGYKRSRKGRVKDSTINIDARTLKAALEVAVTWGRIPANPFRAVKLIRVPKKQIRPFTKEEFTTLCHAIREPWLISVVQFAVLTGLRRGEIMNLRWENVDLGNCRITVESSEEYRVKHGKSRTVPLNDEAMKIVESLRNETPWVFVAEAGQRLRDEAVSKRVKYYIRQADLPEELHFHSLRATCASWGLQKGVSHAVVQSLLGHSSVKTTETYASLDDRSVREGVKMITLPEAA